MSTIKVDNIEPFSGGQVNIQGLNLIGYASTGSNSFEGDQTITGSLTISSSNNIDVNIAGKISMTGPGTIQDDPRIFMSSSYGQTDIGQRTLTMGKHQSESVYISSDFGGLLAIYNQTNFEEFGFNLKHEQYGVGWTGPAIYSDAAGYSALIGFPNQTEINTTPITIFKNTTITGSLNVSGASTFNSNVDINGDLKVNNSTYSALTTTGNPFGLENNHTFFSGQNSLTQTLIIGSGSNNNLATAKAYIASFVGAPGNNGASLTLLNRNSGSDTGTGPVFLTLQNDSTSGGTSILLGGSSTGGKTISVGGSNSNAFIGTFAPSGKTGRIEAYDTATFNSSISFASNPNGGGLLQDYSADTENYATVLEVGNYGDWQNGLIKFYRNAQVSGSWDFSGSVEVKETVTIGEVLKLQQLDPLPNADTGSLAVSGSNLYFYNGTDWKEVQFV